jgi:hypothetical protein
MLALFGIQQPRERPIARAWHVRNDVIALWCEDQFTHLTRHECVRPLPLGFPDIELPARTGLTVRQRHGVKKMGNEAWPGKLTNGGGLCPCAANDENN